MLDWLKLRWRRSQQKLWMMKLTDTHPIFLIMCWLSGKFPRSSYTPHLGWWDDMHQMCRGSKINKKQELRLTIFRAACLWWRVFTTGRNFPVSCISLISQFALFLISADIRQQRSAACVIFNYIAKIVLWRLILEQHLMNNKIMLWIKCAHFSQ